MTRGCGKPGIDNSYGKTVALALCLCYDTSAHGHRVQSRLARYPHDIGENEFVLVFKLLPKM